MTSIPFSVATANDYGCLAALRQLAANGTTSSREEAKAIIIGFYKRQQISEGRAQVSRVTGVLGVPADYLKQDGPLARLEEEAYREGVTQFQYEFIEARRELGLVPSSIFPLPLFSVPTQLDDHNAAWNALRTATNPTDAMRVLEVYVDAKIKKGRSTADISSRLDRLEKMIANERLHRISDACGFTCSREKR